MRLYLEPSVLVKLFKTEIGSNEIIKTIVAIDEKEDWAGYTSRWSTLEVARTLKKDGKPRELILVDLQELKRHKLSLVPVTNRIIDDAEKLAMSYNIYASDALHVATFEFLKKREKLERFLCDDVHFQS